MQKASTWSWTIPYFALYGLVRVGWLSPLTARGIAVPIHVGVAAALTMGAYRALVREDRAGRLFWIAMALLFWFPGVYLEFPSDPWTHLLRSMAWWNPRALASDSQAYRFPYFLQWTLLSRLPPGSEALPSVLGLLAAFNQLMIAVQAYLVARALRFSLVWSRLLVFALFCTFGTNLFGIRYYALSTFPISFLAYLGMVEWVLRRKSCGRWTIAGCAYLLALMFASHKQALLFVALSGGGYLTMKGGRWLLASGRRRITFGATVGIAVLIALAVIFAPELGWSDALCRRIVNWDHCPITRTFQYAVWSPSDSFFETWGLSGFAALLLSLPLLSTAYRCFAWLTLFPMLTLIFPPTVLLYLKAIDHSVVYRTLFAVPSALALVAGLRWICHRAGIRRRALLVCLVLIATAGMIPRKPVRGRLWFALHRFPVERAYFHLLPLVRWFGNDGRKLDGCLLGTDDITMYLLNTHFSLAWGRDPRREPFLFLRGIRSEEELDRFLREHYWLCAFIVPRPDRMPAIPPSAVARLARHWPDERGDQSWYVGRDFSWAFPLLEKRGWRREEAPPFYTIYVNPAHDELLPARSR